MVRTGPRSGTPRNPARQLPKHARGPPGQFLSTFSSQVYRVGHGLQSQAGLDSGHLTSLSLGVPLQHKEVVVGGTRPPEEPSARQGSTPAKAHTER